MKLTPLPAVAVLALSCIGSTSTETDTSAIPPMAPPPHTGTILPPMPAPTHSGTLTPPMPAPDHTGLLPPMEVPPHTGGDTGDTGAAARTSPPPLVRPVR